MKKEQVILVTGSSGQIGNALVNHLLENSDYFIIGIDLKANAIENHRFEFHQGSVLQIDFLNSISERIANSNRLLTGIVNAFVYPEFNNKPRDTEKLLNKFPQIPKRTIELLNAWSQYPTEEAMSSFELNCLGANNVVASQLENLLNSGGSSVVHIASQYGIKVPRQELFQNSQKFSYKPYAYSASKAALIILSEYQASLFSGTNVRVNCISPGSVYREHSEIFVSKVEDSAWTKQMMNLLDVIEPISFLLSEGSRYMNGSNLVVDGGWSRT